MYVTDSSRSENSELARKIMDKSSHLCRWGSIMGRPACFGTKTNTEADKHPMGGDHLWTANDDYPDGSGYLGQTPWLVFKNHVKEKHGLDIKVFSD